MGKEYFLGSIAVLLVLGLLSIIGFQCDRGLKQIAEKSKEQESHDKCINGFVYRRHTEGVLYYQYELSGKPVPCFKIEKVK